MKNAKGVYGHADLDHFTRTVFKEMGCGDDDAALAAEVLIRADLRGIDSHGIARLPGYFRLKEAGRANMRPSPRIIRESPSTATIDADSGLGLVCAPKAMQVAIQKARDFGTGWVCVQNSNHFGIAGYHAMMALEEDMIGIAMTNASALTAPTFSKERMLGTNPIAVAVPAGKQPAFVADMATTTAANGKLELLQLDDSPMPLGWAQDAEGKATHDAHVLKKGGSLLPLGSEREQGSHKGYAMGSIVDILSGVLSGASYGPWAPPFPAYVPLPPQMPGKGLGHFLGAMRIDAFQDADAFKAQMDNWIERFRNAVPIDEVTPVLIPGDPEREQEAQRRASGVPVSPKVIKELIELAEHLAIRHPFH